MKKTLLALTVPALLVAGAAQAATVYDKDGQTFDVYGRAQANIYNKAAGDADRGTLVGTARFGVKGTTAVNDKFGVFGRGEWQVNAENSTNTSSNFKSRHVYAGLDGKELGKLTFGQTDTAFYDSIAATDVFNEWGSNANSYKGRQEGQIIYNNTIGGFRIGTSYQSSNDSNYLTDKDGNYIDAKGNIVTKSNRVKDDSANLKYGYAANLGYTFAYDIGVSAGYALDKFEDGKDKTDWAVSSSYGVTGKPGLYAAAMYNESKTTDAEKIKGYELAGIYTLPNNFAFLGGYNNKKQGDTKITNEWLLGAQYAFTSNAYAYTEYKFNQIKDADDSVTLALQYNF